MHHQYFIFCAVDALACSLGAVDNHPKTFKRKDKSSSKLTQHYWMRNQVH
jgi:hypothetical protein